MIRGKQYVRCLPIDPDDEKRLPKWFPRSQVESFGFFTRYMLQPNHLLSVNDTQMLIKHAHVRRILDLRERSSLVSSFHLVVVTDEKGERYDIDYDDIKWQDYFDSLRPGMIMQVYWNKGWCFIQLTLVGDTISGMVFQKWEDGATNDVMDINPSDLAILGTRF